MSRFSRNAALVLCTLLVSLLLTEAVLRLADFSARWEEGLSPWAPWLVYDPIVGRGNRAGFEGAEFRINARGLRGPELERAKPKSGFRILCLGDSTTFGIWREEPPIIQTRVSYPELLQERIDRQGIAGVEVINAGVLGFTTRNSLRQLASQLLVLEPDVVTLRFGNNDHSPRHRRAAAYVDTEPGFRLFQLLPARLFRWELVRIGFHLDRSKERPLAGRERKVSLEEFERNLLRFVELGRKHDFRVLFLDFPYRALERGLSPAQRLPNWFSEARTLAELHEIHESYFQAVKKVAERSDAPLVHTLPQFRSSPVPVFTDYDLSHPTEAGLRITAERIFEELQARDWLPGSGAVP